MNSPSVSQFRLASVRNIVIPRSDRSPSLILQTVARSHVKSIRKNIRHWHPRLLAVLPSVAFVIKLSSASTRYRIFFRFGGMVYGRKLFWGFRTHS
jgi:hypothetical protein